MKILLLEEFSGLHTFLKKGLEQLGVMRLCLMRDNAQGSIS